MLKRVLDDDLRPQGDETCEENVCMRKTATLLRWFCSGSIIQRSFYIFFATCFGLHKMLKANYS